MNVGFGYSGSEGLERREEGIVSHLGVHQAVYQLVNYPVSVTFSNGAIKKMDKEYKEKSLSSRIKIFAAMRSGIQVPLFFINPNFFGRVQKDCNCTDIEKEYVVREFIYYPPDRSFSPPDEWGGDRSFYNSNFSTRVDDSVVYFIAKYEFRLFRIEKVVDFANAFFSSDETEEKMRLRIDLKENEDWDLTIYQRKTQLREWPIDIHMDRARDTVANDGEGSEREGKKRRVQEVLNPQLDLPTSERVVKSAHLFEENEALGLNCSITHTIMEDPVIGPDGFSYEREAIIEWLKSHGTSPMTRKPMNKCQLIPNRNLKERIQLYLQGQKKMSGEKKDD